MFQVENIKDNDDYLFAYKIVEKQFSAARYQIR